MSRSERLLAIIQTMRGRQIPITAAQLAQEFGVSERTIYRDIGILVSQGALIEGASGFGYVFAPGHFLPPMTFSADEADAIVLGLRFVMRRGDGTLGEGARSALAKIAEVMPPEAALQAKANGLIVGPSSPPRDIISIVKTGIRTGHKLKFDYVNAEGRASQRTVWPVVLGFFDDVEMLAGWCEEKAAFRHFRLDRMDAAEVTEMRIPLAGHLLMARYRELEPGVAL